jgi:hypothetical protein
MEIRRQPITQSKIWSQPGQGTKINFIVPFIVPIGVRTVALLGEEGVNKQSGQGGDHFAQALDGLFGLVRPVGRV